MSIQLFSKDLPAAWAYAADELSSHGYEAEANIIRNDTGLHLDVNDSVYNCFISVTAKLMALRTLVTGAKTPARQVPSADMHAL